MLESRSIRHTLACFLAAAAAVPTAPPTVLAKAPAAAADNKTPTAKTAKPAAPSPVEVEHISRLDRAIAAARDYRVSAEDAARIREAAKAFSGRNLEAGLGLEQQIADPVGRKLVSWIRLRSGLGDPAEVRDFLERNPTWPDRPLLVRRMEEALFIKGGSANGIKAFFASAEPQTGVGLAALASAYLAEGNVERAKALAARAWREEPFPDALEAGFLQRFGAHLTQADHKWRLDRLLLDDLRWNASRNDRAEVVRRLIPLLSPAEQKKAKARLAVFLRSSSAKTLLADLPADARAIDYGLLFHRIQQLRRQGRKEEAAKLLLAAPTAPEKIVSPDDWWVERRALAYEALDANKPILAYDLVRDAGPLSVNPLKEQAFMAGWIALRYLKKPAAAEVHFSAMRKAADGPLSRAKSEYWLGRTFEAQGNKAKAAERYRLAARDADTFHGMLALQKLNPERNGIEVRPPAAPTSDEISRFNDLDTVKALVITKRADLAAVYSRAFISHLGIIMKSEGELAMVAHLADTLGDTQAAVRVAKYGVAGGRNLLYYSYPVHPFPAYTPLRDPPEAAVLLGIARQESEFDTSIVSGAGARGLLQVMPVTANHVCRDYKLKCDIGRLLRDKPYNTMLASAYIGDRMREFNGSYVLTLAGYNAGPGRAREWMRRFGDPRDPKVDPIDWIERIPFQETREYVSKVLSNIQIYRARIGEAATALRLEEDLRRGRSQANATPAASDRAASAE